MSVRRPLVLAAAAVVAGTPAFAHVGSVDHVHAFADGVLHPLTGPDHLLAMVALGVWAALIGGVAVAALPVAFPLAMALGAALALGGVPVPGAEAGIALSSAVLGLAIAARVRPPLALGVAVTAAFALCHGWAHGAELPADAAPWQFAVGFVLATVALHGAGIALGFGARRLLQRPWGAALVRAGGAALSLFGAAMLVGAA